MADSEVNQAAEPVPESSRPPHLIRTDQAADHLAMSIRSVYYHFDLGHLCCAVLVRISFVLRKRKLHYALVSLVATPPTSLTQRSEGDNEQPVEIIAQFPSIEEWAEVDRESVGKDVLPDSTISGDHEKERRYKISLTPLLKPSDPVYLQWTFEDKNGVYYPSEVDVIIVVSKSHHNHQYWFPFELQIQAKVDLHGLANRIRRLLPRSDKHDGWFFRIEGQYLPTLAKDALEDAKAAEAEIRAPKLIGLHAAVKSSRLAETQH